MRNKYSKLKVFAFEDKIASLRGHDVMAPLVVRIKPNNRCNHSCWYCSYRLKEQTLGSGMNEGDVIPERKIVEIIGDLARMGTKAVIMSGGGEPLVYPYLRSALDALLDTELKLGVLTNGSNLKGYAAEVLAERGSWVRISIDGWDDQSYSEYRGVGDKEYSKVMGNIRQFALRDRSCFLGASIIVDNKNAPYLDVLVDQLISAGVDSVKIAPCVISDSVAVNNAYHAEIEPVVRDRYDKVLARSYDAEIYYSYHQQLGGFQKEYAWCPYAQIVPVIGADQNVYTCHDKAYTEGGLLGSIAGVTFEDFWSGSGSRLQGINPKKICDHHCMVDEQNRLLIDLIASGLRPQEYLDRRGLHDEFMGIDESHLEFV